MLSGQTDLKCPYCYILKISIYLVKHLLVSIWVCLQSLPLLHSHRQQGIEGMRNPTTSDKSGPKGPGKLLKRANWSFLQPIKPSHHHWPQTKWEYLAHQGLILQMNSHSLVKMTDMLHWICPTIIHGKCWLGELLRKFSPLNPLCKRWLWNLM